jgi:D-arabinose 1-dehydrogenase-like Zn-dependent alcohol dehydrogenase
MSDADAAPLMCTGATVFGALQAQRAGGVRPTHRVGVPGLGGLGHLAVQYARAFGCGVVVFSGSEGKREEAMRLGATEFYATRDVETLKRECKPVDHLIVCSSVMPDWGVYLDLVAPEGAVYPLL